MEQILAFVLGVSAGVIVWAVVVAFRTAKLAKQNEQSIRNVEEWISRNDEMVNRRIDQEIDRTNNIYNDCIRHTDSRVDKLEQKYLDQTQAKQLIKG
jgi:hypothetical protein